MNTIRKDFKHGDMYITTSHRQVRHMGICGGVADAGKVPLEDDDGGAPSGRWRNLCPD